MLSQEQAEQIKTQLLAQLEGTNLPNKESIKENIETMNPRELEDFLKQNKLVKENGEENQQCVFCSIVSGKIQSYKISEDKNTIAVLEIKPISKGHAIIIPKKHIPSEKKFPKTGLKLAQKIAKNIKEKFGTSDVSIYFSNLFDHEIINILPVYKDENQNSKRYQAEQEELISSQEKLMEKGKIKSVRKPRTEKITEKIWLPRRIP